MTSTCEHSEGQLQTESWSGKAIRVHDARMGTKRPGRSNERLRGGSQSYADEPGCQEQVYPAPGAQVDTAETKWKTKKTIIMMMMMLMMLLTTKIAAADVMVKRLQWSKRLTWKCVKGVVSLCIDSVGPVKAVFSRQNLFSVLVIKGANKLPEY